MRRLTLSFALVLAAIGCTNEIDISTRPANVLGTYHLVRFDGRSLPAVIASDTSGTLQIVSSELVIAGDHAWTETLTHRFTPRIGPTVLTPQVSRGSWSFVRDYAYMIFNDKTSGYQFSGVVAGGGVTLDLVSGEQLIYTR